MPDQDQEQPQPPQRQSQPGIEEEMAPEPDTTRPQYQGSGKLAGKVALITGGDSGIGRAVAVLFAREGADVAIGHLPDEDTDANGRGWLSTRRMEQRLLSSPAGKGLWGQLLRLQTAAAQPGIVWGPAR